MKRTLYRITLYRSAKREDLLARNVWLPSDVSARAHARRWLTNFRTIHAKNPGLADTWEVMASDGAGATRLVGRGGVEDSRFPAPLPAVRKPRQTES